MARARRTAFTFESNIPKVIAKIEATPEKVMNVVGQNIVREVKATTMNSQFHQRRAILKKTLSYWARKKEKDLQIGFKMSIPGIVGKMMTGAEDDPIKPVVIKNAQLIQDMVAVALNEIGKRE
ncbi:hypothetical protein [Acetobacterium sp.]|uniref:hypothetical protein n=1 Tax=Acetobacterium sp. TaxID=1872094 RepID=UPI002F3EFD28